MRKPPGFELETIDGGTVSLADLVGLGRPLLLVFSDAHCTSCRELAPDVARWQREHASRLTVAVVASGGAAANREDARANGLSRVLLQFDGALRAEYGVPATPSAVLIGSDGAVASSIAAGPHAIRDLVDRTVGGAAAEPAVTRLDGHLDAAARALAGPVPRRRALAILAGAFAAVAVPSLLRPRRALAAHDTVCPITAPTDCECSPAKPGCGGTTCPPLYRCCWQPCIDPNGCTCPSTYCCYICDPSASQCGSGTGPDCAPGPIAPECCGPDSRICGEACCPNDSDCCNGKCCSPGERCVSGECIEPELCSGDGNRIKRITVGDSTFPSGRMLIKGEVIQAGSEREIYEMENGTKLKLAPGTKFRVGPDCVGQSEFEEFVGKIWADVKKAVAGSDEKFKITAPPGATLGVRGTSFSFEYEPARKRTTAKVTSGSVELRGRGKARGKVIVRKGQTAIQQGNKPPKLIKD
jgi:hypothetical protein